MTVLEIHSLFKQHSPFRYQRRRTRVVPVGTVLVGGNNPLRVQSMTTTSTMDTPATVEQTRRLADVGCEIVRITAPTVRDAANLENIKSALLQKNCTVPLVADIHFRPDAALVAADYVEKVRINPGNFSDGKMFRVREYSDEQYLDELKRIEDKFTPLVLKLKKNKKTLRIGTNHGSLSDRIMNRFGDTPLGMVESALEFVRICEKNDFHDIILSMKSSNPKVMIGAYRLLSQRMEQENMNYPFHLGVTEAGDGEDGRIKSAVGIGGLLEDGIGDTIRVSLTEDPEFEIPVAQSIAKTYSLPSYGSDMQTEVSSDSYSDDFVAPRRRATEALHSGPIALGGDHPVRVVSRIDLTETPAEHVLDLLERRVKSDTLPEILEIPYTGPAFNSVYEKFRQKMDAETSRLTYWVAIRSGNVPAVWPAPVDGIIYDLKDDTSSPSEWDEMARKIQELKCVLVLRSADVDVLLKAAEFFSEKEIPLSVGVGAADKKQFVYQARTVTAQLNKKKIACPLVIFGYDGKPDVSTASVFGSLLCDGLGDAIRVSLNPPTDVNLDFSYNLLQACGNRITKTEYVSCPSCGRTLFNLQETTERIKSKTDHLKGVKIAIMGCIVNGPGEMADADFGYVGGGPGKINLYVGKTCVEKSIPTAEADDKLIQLIKSHGKWVNPS